MALSPMMQQYLQVKESCTDCILLFRLGDFYEMFYEDAETGSRELELVLTGRDCGTGERAPMCGVPFHSADGYITRLVKKGYKVAICEQLEDPALAKGIVKRDIVRIITPGTVTEGDFLTDGENNYICSLFRENDVIGAAFADISTGEVNATQIEGEDPLVRLFSETAAYSPSEAIMPAGTGDEITKHFTEKYGAPVTALGSEYYSGEDIPALLEKQFGDNFPAKKDSPAAKAAGALLLYLKETQRSDISYISKLNYYVSAAFLSVDGFSRRNLEICANLRDGEKKGSLLWVLDKTKTAPGARLMKKWLERPLINCAAIIKRQDAVGELAGDAAGHAEITEILKNIVDIERLSTRLFYGTANAKDLKLLEQSINVLPSLKKKLGQFRAAMLAGFHNELDVLADLGESIKKTITDDPPFTLKEGGIIMDGCNPAVDELRAMLKDGRGWIAKIESRERGETGIKALKVGYNKIFGYYIEVTNSFLGQVPPRYIRRQTLSNCERYVTEELKDIESRVIGAKDKLSALEYEIFCALREHILDHILRIQAAAAIIAQTDVLASLAAAAREYNYARPEVDISDKIVLKDSRHPVAEKFMQGSYFVPNDCNMDCASNNLLIITGPNMAGKSTYMRQIALCVIMAQIGSFVPARDARIGIVDKIFTRVGAADDMSAGDSTFMLEMREVAEILKNATKQSLIIYDEIGRGTSTYDGMSIAKAVVEHTRKKIAAKTLFATHYHELTGIENELDGVVNYNIAAKKRGEEIIFLRKIIRGAADDSYGIEVARLAGIPEGVVSRAKQILKTLDGGEKFIPKKSGDDININFGDIKAENIKQKLNGIDLNTITPYEAMNLLYELKKEAE